MKTKVIAVSTTKGGTGKTTTAANLAAGLAHKMAAENTEGDVLLIDLDHQGSAADYFGVHKHTYDERRNPGGPCISQVLLGDKRPFNAMLGLRENLWLIPATEMLRPTLQKLGIQDAVERLSPAGSRNRDHVFLPDVLAKRLKPVMGEFPYIVVDCPPNPGNLEAAIVKFADFIVAPSQLEYLSVAGLWMFTELLAATRVSGEGKAQLLYVLPTMTSPIGKDGIPHQVAERDMLEHLRDMYGDKVLPPIPMTAAIKEAPAYSKSIFEYAPTSRAAHLYGILVEKVVNNA